MEMIGQLHVQAALPSGNKRSDAANQRMGGCQSRCGRFEEERKLLLLSGFKPRTFQFVTRSLTPPTPPRVRYDWLYANRHPLNISLNVLGLTGH